MCRDGNSGSIRRFLHRHFAGTSMVTQRSRATIRRAIARRCLTWEIEFMARSVRCHALRGARCYRPGRLRARSVRLLRPPSEPRRLVRHVRPHRLLLSGRQPALLERQLPLAPARRRSAHRRAASGGTAFNCSIARSCDSAHATPANHVDCSDFSQRRGERASMYSRPFGLSRRPSGASLQGGPSRAN